MPAQTQSRRIFVAGATGFLGTGVVYALLQAGAEVTALIPPGAAFRLHDPERQVRLVEGDAWNPGSLTGRSRGHDAVIHLIGSMHQQASRGLTCTHLNFTSLHNITRMAIGDGVPRVLFLSAAGAPWMPGDYIESKREAERYLRRSGVTWTIIRAPLVYPRGRLQNPLLILVALLGAIPVLGRPFTRWAPLPVDVAARGIAGLALDSTRRNQTVYGHTLRQISQQQKREHTLAASPALPGHGPSSHAPEEEPPFGWLP